MVEGSFGRVVEVVEGGGGAAVDGEVVVEASIGASIGALVAMVGVVAVVRLKSRMMRGCWRESRKVEVGLVYERRQPPRLIIVDKARDFRDFNCCCLPDHNKDLF